MGFERVGLATDLGETALIPWVHALRLCMQRRVELTIVHVADSGDPRWESLVPAQRLADAWGLDSEGLTVLRRTLHVGPAVEVLGEVMADGPELLVVGTHRPGGLTRLWRGSVSEQLTRHARGATLIVPDGARGFVQPDSGVVSLTRILIPLGDAGADRVLDDVYALLDAAGVEKVEITWLHIGPGPLPIQDPPSRPGVHHHQLHLSSGDVVGRILQTCTSIRADLVAMCTQGHDSWSDELWGSRTERVVRDAGVPVLVRTLTTGSDGG